MSLIPKKRDPPEPSSTDDGDVELTAAKHKRRNSITIAVSLVLLLILLAVPADAGSLRVRTVSPTDGQTVSGTVAWAVAVTPNNINHVDFSVDGTLRATETGSPWSLSLDTLGFA